MPWPDVTVLLAPCHHKETHFHNMQIDEKDNSETLGRIGSRFTA